MIRKIAAFGILMGALSGCSTVYPLKNVAYRSSDPHSLDQDVTVDVLSEDLKGLKTLSWVAYSATFECPRQCPYTMSERTELAREIAEHSFASLDDQLRLSLAGSEHELIGAGLITGRPEFAPDVRTDSFKKTVSRWIARLGLAAAPEVVAPAGHLKSIDPGELGWSGARGLADLGKKLGLDGVLVGHVRVTVSDDKDEPRRLIIQGPRLWLYSSTSGAAAVAGLKPTWRLDPIAPTDPEAASAVSKFDAARELKDTKLDWRGFDAVAAGMSTRVAHALSND